jgi:hypothetical protein
VLVVAAACLFWVTGCETSTKLTGMLDSQRDDPATTASIGADPATTGSVSGSAGTPEQQ